MYQAITKQLSGMAGREQKVTRNQSISGKKMDLNGLRMIDLTSDFNSVRIYERKTITVGEVRYLAAISNDTKIDLSPQSLFKTKLKKIKK